MDNADEITASKFRRLVELREARDTDKVTAENSEKEYRDYEASLFEELADSPVKGTRRIDLGPPFGLITFTPRETKYGRIIDSEQALEYFALRMMTPEMTKPTISKAKLNELIRERLEAGKPLPPGVDWYASRGVTISRKSK